MGRIGGFHGSLEERYQQGNKQHRRVRLTFEISRQESEFGVVPALPALLLIKVIKFSSFVEAGLHFRRLLFLVTILKELF